MGLRPILCMFVEGGRGQSDHWNWKAFFLLVHLVTYFKVSIHPLPQCRGTSVPSSDRLPKSFLSTIISVLVTRCFGKMTVAWPFSALFTYFQMSGRLLPQCRGATGPWLPKSFLSFTVSRCFSHQVFSTQAAAVFLGQNRSASDSLAIARVTAWWRGGKNEVEKFTSKNEQNSWHWWSMQSFSLT